MSNNKPSLVITHLISGLGAGGAETMLKNIVTNPNSEFKHKVISLGLSSFLETHLGDMNVEVVVLNIRKHPIKSFLFLRQAFSQTEFLCCWMYISCLLGYLTFKNHKNTIWCIRHSDTSFINNSLLTYLLIRVEARLSSYVGMVLFNGKRAMENHQKLGFSQHNCDVVENGCDLSLFHFNISKRNEARRSLGINDKQILLLSVSRDSRIKDIPNFIQTVSIIKQMHPDVVAVLCGSGLTSGNSRLKKLCNKYKLTIGRDIILLGFVEDVVPLLCAADIYILHSKGEAFPNALLQALACGRISVATDVGDVNDIMSGSAFISQTHDPQSLAKHIDTIIRLPLSEKEKMEEANRKNVEKRYDINKVCDNYEHHFSTFQKTRYIIIMPSGYKSFQYGDAVYRPDCSLIPVKNCSRKIFKVLFTTGLLRLSPIKAILLHWVRHLLRSHSVLDASPNRKTVFIIYSRLVESLGYNLIDFVKSEIRECTIYVMFGDLVCNHNIEIAKVSSVADCLYTFDEKDALTHHMKWCMEPFPAFLHDRYDSSLHKKYDVVFIGEAKDRYDRIIQVFEKLKAHGLKCDFHITGVRLKDRKYVGEIHYRKLSFSDLLQHSVDSRCILEIMQSNGSSPTMRFPEAMLSGNNLLTDCRHFKDSDRRASNIFFFDDINDLDKTDLSALRMTHKYDKGYYIRLFSFERFLMDIDEIEGANCG